MSLRENGNKTQGEIIKEGEASQYLPATFSAFYGPLSSGPKRRIALVSPALSRHEILTNSLKMKQFVFISLVMSQTQR